MNRFLKSAVLSAAVVATTLGSLPAAHAGDNWRHHRYNDNGDLVAAGVLGLAVGAIAAGIATSEPRYYDGPAYYDGPVYREPRPRPHPNRVYLADPEVVYIDDYGLEPWSPEWYRYCEDRYRSFNPRTGTFTGYDGLKHFCQAN